MGKIKYKGLPLLPLPTVLVGANVNGKPNFLTVAFCGCMNIDPPIMYVALNKAHYTNAGIRENGLFSVNVPTVEMVRVTDYCGLKSGHDVDKSQLFDVFYGELKDAPLIGECPVNVECKLLQTLDFPNDEIFIGEIVQVHMSEDCLTDGKPDPGKLDPLIYFSGTYREAGKVVAAAHKVGADYQKP